MSRKRITVLFIVFIMLVGTLTACGKDSNGIEITNVSYDPTRELYEAYNKEFIKYWKDKTGEDVTITQSHGGSGKQARSVIEGNEADVVTLALAHDVTAIEEAGLIDSGWINEFDKNSSPYTSTIVFLVRKDNAKNIKDWNDLIKDGVEVITPNPKTSGGACWNFLAAWAYAKQLYNGDEASMKDFVTKLYQNVIVLDSGARGATTTFVENGQGDVLIAWENEAYLSVKEHPDEFEIITPSISILAEPSVAVVDETVNRRDTAEVSKAYLEYLYSDTAQRIAGDNFYRPSNPDILKEYEDVFDLNVNLVTVDEEYG
ncbi:MAG TPA: sulfate ABC transporter substrate-binding protein, partial [Lachnospiraceae bacterium]|nr:sulfate ABC transporter substrate-binding protein [Lachnospiraceae bacterium]